MELTYSQSKYFIKAIKLRWAGMDKKSRKNIFIKLKPYLKKDFMDHPTIFQDGPKHSIIKRRYEQKTG